MAEIETKLVQQAKLVANQSTNNDDLNDVLCGMVDSYKLILSEMDDEEIVAVANSDRLIMDTFIETMTSEEIDRNPGNRLLGRLRQILSYVVASEVEGRENFDKSELRGEEEDWELNSAPPPDYPTIDGS